jgi:hypothetical protein
MRVGKHHSGEVGLCKKVATRKDDENSSGRHAARSREQLDAVS